jgi:hypothetical protein
MRIAHFRVAQHIRPAMLGKNNRLHISSPHAVSAARNPSIGSIDCPAEEAIEESSSPQPAITAPKTNQEEQREPAHGYPKRVFPRQEQIAEGTPFSK